MKYFCGTRAVGTGVSPVEVSMCIRKGYIRDDITSQTFLATRLSPVDPAARLDNLSNLSISFCKYKLYVVVQLYDRLRDHAFFPSYAFSHFLIVYILALFFQTFSAFFSYFCSISLRT